MLTLLQRLIEQTDGNAEAVESIRQHRRGFLVGALLALLLRLILSGVFLGLFSPLPLFLGYGTVSTRAREDK